MNRILLFFGLMMLLSSCGMTSTLYYWGGGTPALTKYEALVYLSSDKQTDKSICELVCLYEDMVSNPAGIRKLPPPGICAEYGYLLLQPQTAEIFLEQATKKQKSMFKENDYATLFRERGKEMLQMEMKIYPESINFIKPLLEKFAK